MCLDDLNHFIAPVWNELLPNALVIYNFSIIYWLMTDFCVINLWIQVKRILSINLLMIDMAYLVVEIAEFFFPFP